MQQQQYCQSAAWMPAVLRHQTALMALLSSLSSAELCEQAHGTLRVETWCLDVQRHTC
jgi:hypothetical protein